MFISKMPKRKRSEHYVNNKEFLAALIEYRTNVEISYMKEFKEDLTLLPNPERAKKWNGKATYSKIHWRMLLEDCKSFIIQTKLCELYVQRGYDLRWY